MLDLNHIRQHTDEVRAALGKRDMGLDATLDRVLELDQRRRAVLGEVEAMKKARNDNSKQIGMVMKSGGDAEELKQETKRLGTKIAELEEESTTIHADLHTCMVELPNIPDPSVPEGKSDADNQELRSWGDKPEMSFEPKPHWDLGTDLGILDLERATKVAGARFSLMRGAGARLERALIQFMLDLQTDTHGYTELVPPFMVNEKAMFGTGQLPKFEADLFKVEPHSFYLIPTAEVPVTYMHADEILDNASLPLKYCAYTPCFRSEAGSYGRDVRGLIRLHQFNKVELVRFCRPEESAEQLELLTSHAEEVLKRPGLHYRTMVLCTGDMGFHSAKTYDLEVWLPSQKAYREISSCSNFGTFQARRSKIRYRPEGGGKAALVHTLNGSGLAVGRTLVAVLENYQRADGSVEIPEALLPYMGGKTVLTPE